jgi:NADH-quinone oxidoreductase subunit G
MADEIKTFKVTIDNITIDVPVGTTVLNAARIIGGEVAPPAMCYYSKLQGSGGKMPYLPGGSSRRFHS